MSLPNNADLPIFHLGFSCRCLFCFRQPWHRVEQPTVDLQDSDFHHVRVLHLVPALLRVSIPHLLLCYPSERAHVQRTQNVPQPRHPHRRTHILQNELQVTFKILLVHLQLVRTCSFNFWSLSHEFSMIYPDVLHFGFCIFFKHMEKTIERTSRNWCKIRFLRQFIKKGYLDNILVIFW